ncbi:MAG: IS66 family insertion sequence element accessory protein TnpB [Gammaproteobacteria bacterium]|nr:IS66 family insertion sequence element accessory protein TnpB [Gammaproteobacteria bacterium]
MYWDKTGFALWYKRLEQEKFKWPRKNGEAVLSLTEIQLHLLLDGYDITKMPYRCIDKNKYCNASVLKFQERHYQTG